MDELIDLVVKKTGISKEAAKKAVDTVLTFLKQKLPAPIAAQLDAALGNPGTVQDIAKGLGGLLGKK